MRRWIALLVVATGCSSSGPPRAVTKEELGSLLFNDPRLSEPAGQACADCHAASQAFADPEDDRASQGIVPGRFSLRNAQPVMYSSFVPPLRKDPATGRMTGGLFWDGRASTLEEQALPPLLNPLEMNNPSKEHVVAKIRKHYAREFKRVFGERAFESVDRTFAHIGDAIAAFERTPQFVPFSSKYDRYLAGKATLDEVELRGLAIFEDPARGNCASCHPSRPGPDGSPPLFTSFAYENLGVPRFADSPFYLLPPDLNPEGTSFIDRGLGKTTNDARHDGMFRVPSLRNAMLTGPYTHNGYFRRLDEVVAFMAGHEVKDAEVPETADRSRLAPSLSDEDVQYVVAFLRTLTDEMPQ